MKHVNRYVLLFQKRNRELAQLLEQHSQANEQLNKQLQDLVSSVFISHEPKQTHKVMFADNLWIVEIWNIKTPELI